MTPFARLSGRSVAPKKVKWVRHPSAKSLVRQFFRGMGARPEELVDPNGNFVLADEGMLGTVREAGMWAFTLSDRKVPVVHYWASAKANRLELAFLLGHEMGHSCGKKLRSQRNAMREELRADEYGACVAAVLKHLRGVR